jgi:hypothetical protein
MTQAYLTRNQFEAQGVAYGLLQGDLAFRLFTLSWELDRKLQDKHALLVRVLEGLRVRIVAQEEPEFGRLVETCNPHINGVMDLTVTSTFRFRTRNNGIIEMVVTIASSRIAKEYCAPGFDPSKEEPSHWVVKRIAIHGGLDLARDLRSGPSTGEVTYIPRDGGPELSTCISWNFPGEEDWGARFQ